MVQNLDLAPFIKAARSIICNQLKKKQTQMQQSRPLIIAAAATTTLMSITPRTQAVNLACPEEPTSVEPYFEGGFDDNISQMMYFEETYEETTIITTTETTYTTWEDNEGD